MNSIFIVETEHHLFQVNAAIEHFSLDLNSTTLVVLDTGNNSFIVKVKSSKEYGKVVIFQNWIFKDLFFNRRKIRVFRDFCKGLKDSRKNITLFASHYDSDPDLLFLSIVKPKMYYLMDEGTASFSVINARKKRSNKVLNLFVKSILYGCNIALPQNLTYFTKYNLDKGINDKLEKYIIKQLENPLSNLIEDEFAFIGTSIVEHGMVSETQYLSLLTEICKNNNDKKKYYYPHRKESQIKLSRIERIGFLINKIDEPFETMFEKTDGMSRTYLFFLYYRSIR